MTTSATAPAPSDTTITDNASSVASNDVSRYDPSGVLAGVVFPQPVSLDEVRAVASQLQGDPIGVYRTHYACVQPVAGEPDWRPVPSRFAMADADTLRRELRLGEAPGMAAWVSDAYWEHWTDQWRHALEPGVQFEAAVVYMREEMFAALGSDPRFRAVVELVPRVAPGEGASDLPYERFLNSEEFPAGLLTEAPWPDDCSYALTWEEEDATLWAELRMIPPTSWAELHQPRTRQGQIFRLTGIVPAESVNDHGFILYVDGDPKQQVWGYYDYSAGPTEDLRFAGFWSRSAGPGHTVEPPSGAVTAWGHSSLDLTTAESPDVVEGFHFIAWGAQVVIHEWDESLCYIKDIYSRGGKDYIVVDYITLKGPEEDLHVINDNPRLRTFEIPKDAWIGFHTLAQAEYDLPAETGVRGTLADLKRLRLLEQYWWVIKVADGKVVSIVELWTP